MTKTKKKNIATELIVILDMSGSMHPLTGDTIGGFNSLIDDQRGDKEKVNVSLVVFNSEYHKLLDRVPIEDVPELTDKEYHPRGTTALLDAIGKTIAEMPELPKKTKIMMSITTDGMENSSVEYTKDTVKKMIENKQKEGWEILFVGANIDAVQEAGKLGIRADRAVNYRSDSIGTTVVLDALSSVVKDYKKTEGNMDKAWERASKVIDDDYQNRK